MSSRLNGTLVNLNSNYKKSLFVSWNLNIQQMFLFPHYLITITDSGLRLNNASEKAQKTGKLSQK